MGKAHYEAILKVKTKKRIYLFDIIESQSKSIKLINNDLNKTEVCKNLDEIVKKLIFNSLYNSRGKIFNFDRYFE